MLVGGIAANFGEDGSSYRIGSGREFVIEGDEYDSAFFDKTAKFLKYLPDIAVIGNIEFDHADIYADLDEIRLAFRRLVNLVPGARPAAAGRRQPRGGRDARVRAVAGADVRPGRRGRLVRLRPPRHRRGHVVRRSRRRRGRSGRFEVPLLGAHNVRNALAAIAVGHAVGLDAQTLADGLARFKGVKRRLEALGTVAGVTVYDDFAHHPTAIAETLAALRAAHPERPDSGRLRAALRLVVPQGLPAGVRRLVPRGRRRDHRGGVPIEPPGGPAAVGRAAGGGPRRRPGRRRATFPSSTASWTTLVARAPGRRPGGADVERRLRRHSREAAWTALSGTGAP